jgi:hypothetical protein
MDSSNMPASEPLQKSEMMFGHAQIGEFGKNPDKFLPLPAVEMPPGAPISMPGNSCH